MEATLDDQDGSLYVILLDWSKAFDRIHHDGLIIALRRFGITGAMLELISNIHQSRSFQVVDGAVKSQTLPQPTGIAQGCPLSPYLFVILMSIVLGDAKFKCRCAETKPYVVTSEVAYADDTTLLTSTATAAQEYFDSIVQTGLAYGLEVNLEKTLVLRIRGETDIYGHDGQPLQVKKEAVYLGGLLCTDGYYGRELSRRIGEARAVFNALAAVWRHSNINKFRKREMFEACVSAKPMYGLDSIWLLKAERKKLNAFYVNCLRKIAGILPSFLSRVPNRSVLELFHACPLSLTLHRRQLALFSRIATQADSCPCRRITFDNGGVVVRTWPVRRSVGRPCHRWISCVVDLTRQLVGDNMETVLDPAAWKSLLQTLREID
jgi:hypothetical protein